MRTTREIAIFLVDRYAIPGRLDEHAARCILGSAPSSAVTGSGRRQPNRARGGRAPAAFAGRGRDPRPTTRVTGADGAEAAPRATGKRRSRSTASSPGASCPRSTLRNDRCRGRRATWRCGSLNNPDESVKVNIYNAGRLVQPRRARAAEPRPALPPHRRREADGPAAAHDAVARLRSLRRQAAGDRLGLPQPAQADQQPLQGARRPTSGSRA